MSGSGGDEAAGRVRAWRDAWMANVGDSHVIMAWLGRATTRTPSDDCPELTIPDLDALLDERKQLLEAGQLAEAQLTEISFERAEWKARAQRGDVVAKVLRTDLGKATARAEQAEAEVERLKARLEFAWNEGDRLANNLIDAVFGDDARRGEFQQKWSRIAALGDPEPEYRYLLADGTESEFDLHNGPCDCQRQVRDVYVTPWRSAERRPRQPHEPIRDQQDVDDLAAAPEDRLSPEEAAEFLKNIAECRGEEEGSNHGDA